MKQLIRRVMAQMGYEIRRNQPPPAPEERPDAVVEVDTLQSLRDRLAWSETLRRIHTRDSLEIAQQGYELRRIQVPPPVPAENQDAAAEVDKLRSLRERLDWSETLHRIHTRDTVEIEELLRYTDLPGLPRREGREQQLAQLIGTKVSAALYIVAALHESLAVEGDICEFGVAQGATSTLIASEIMGTSRRLFLFDSFEGLPAPTKEDRLIDDIFNLGSMEAYQGTMASPESQVLARLAEINFPAERTVVMKGWVNETLAMPEAPRQVAFAYLDLDFYEPTRDSLRFMDAHMPPGGRVVVDDCGFFSEGAQVAIDEFMASTEGRWTLHKPLPFAGHFVTLRRIA